MLDPNDAMKFAVSQMKAFAENDDLFAHLAMINRKVYDAHIDAGFTEEQAFQIMMNTKLGS